MPAFLIAAKRSAVAPMGGAFAALEVDALAAPVMRACLSAGGVDIVDEVMAGNALYGGGNPARRAALLAGLPELVPAVTLDRQCCSGLDAIILAARMVEAGAADCVLAGGVESYSRAPLRMRRPATKDEAPVGYDRPPFTPWPDRDPDMPEAAAHLAALRAVDEDAQAAFAVESHARARAAAEAGRFAGEIVAVAGLSHDSFARRLTLETCRRSRPLAGKAGHRVLAATAAVSADAAAFALVVSQDWLDRNPSVPACRIVAGGAAGGDPCLPGLAPVEASRKVLSAAGIESERLAASEVMEAYAVQAMACIEDLGLDPATVNRGGGALARGHPIGASGAILAVRLFHELQREDAGSFGLTAIASAGGLGSALLLQRV
ncbi:thiolase family protein [Stappia indica]|uniref:thiolase family protein n=1 Tax=Stappia indica TaxID=538381 RepID=UPI000836082C|nr:thiolase family protein [Stappia indica]